MSREIDNKAVLDALNALNQVINDNFDRAVKSLELIAQAYSTAPAVDNTQEAIVEELDDQASVEEMYQDQILAHLIELQEKSARIRSSNKRIKKLVSELFNKGKETII
jgi:hypothetical protein